MILQSHSDSKSQISDFFCCILQSQSDIKAPRYLIFSVVCCRATVISEHPDIWFKDDDNLTYRVCEDGKSRTIIYQDNEDLIIPMIYMKYPPTQFHPITSVIV